MREHAAWNVDTHIRCPTGPTSWATRSRISPAALFVKVIARISNGDAPSSATRYARRCVSTRVFPEPAPAITRTGPAGSVTASYWAGFSPERSRLRPRAGTAGSVSTMTNAWYRGRITRVSVQRGYDAAFSASGAQVPERARPVMRARGPYRA